MLTNSVWPSGLKVAPANSSPKRGAFALRYVDERVISNDDMPRRVFELVRNAAAD